MSSILSNLHHIYVKTFPNEIRACCESQDNQSTDDLLRTPITACGVKILGAVLMSLPLLKITRIALIGLGAPGALFSLALSVALFVASYDLTVTASNRCSEPLSGFKAFASTFQNVAIRGASVTVFSIFSKVGFDVTPPKFLSPRQIACLEYTYGTLVANRIAKFMIG